MHILHYVVFYISSITSHWAYRFARMAFVCAIGFTISVSCSVLRVSGTSIDLRSSLWGESHNRQEKTWINTRP